MWMPFNSFCNQINVIPTRPRVKSVVFYPQEPPKSKRIRAALGGLIRFMFHFSSKYGILWMICGGRDGAVLCMLLTFVAEAEQARFARFYADYEQKMYAVALRLLGRHAVAEDCVYHSFLKIINHFEKISSLPCHNQEAYVVMIVKNTALDMRKAERRLSPLPQGWDPPAPGGGPEEAAGYHYLVELIRALPEGYRQVLEPALVLEVPVKEIARRLGLKENTVAARLSRGGILAISPQARAWGQSPWGTWFDTNTEYAFYGAAPPGYDPEAVWRPTYLPEGFDEVSSAGKNGVWRNVSHTKRNGLAAEQLTDDNVYKEGF